MRRILATKIASTVFGVLTAVSAASAGPVGYWSFDGNVNDQSGYGDNAVPSNLTYANSVPSALSSNIQSGSFDGSDTSVSAPVGSTSSPLYLNNVETITLWMNALNTDQSGQYRRAFSNSNGTGIEFQEDGGGTGSSVRIDTSAGNNQLTEIGPAYDGNWDFLAVVLNGNSVTTYFNGAQTSSNTFALGTGFGSTSPVKFGNSDQESSDWLTGLISNAAIYNTALTANQVQSLYDGASPLSVPEPAMLGIVATAGFGSLLLRRRSSR